MFLSMSYHTGMKSSAEAIARAVRVAESGKGYDISASGLSGTWDPLDPLPFLVAENVIDGTPFAISTKGDKVSLTDMEDVRPPFPITVVGFSVHHIYKNEPGWEETRRQKGYGPDYVYLSITRWMPEEDRMEIFTGAGFEDNTDGYIVLVPVAYWEASVDSSTGKILGDLHYGSYIDTNDATKRGEHDAADGYVLRSTLAIFNMANCANVEIVEPRRSRPERRRIERVTKTAITNLMIRSKARRYSGSYSQQDEGHMPLHTVRGHVSHYGDCCPGSHPPRGKLFGKYDRKVWVPSHARGAEENGVRHHTYEAQP